MNDLEVPVPFPVQKQVMRARLHIICQQSSREYLSLKFLVKSHPERILPGDKCERLPIRNTSAFKPHARKQKDVLSSGNTRVCSEACWCRPGSPGWTERPQGPRGPGCTRTARARL